MHDRRAPLRDTTAERSVLGRAFYRPATEFAALIAEIAPEMFWLPAHQRLFALLVKRHRRGEQNDLIAIKNYLERHEPDLLRDLGGVPGLASFTDDYLQGSDWHGYVGIVRDYWRKRRVETIGRAIIDEAYGEGSADEVESDATAKLTGLAKAAQRPTRSLGDALEQRFNATNAARVPTGLHVLDDALLGGLLPGYYVLAARTSEGKSALALSMLARMMFDHAKSALIASVEMSDDLIATRLAAIEARLVATQLINGNSDHFTPEMWTAISTMVDRLRACACVVHDRDLKPSIIRSRAHVLKAEGKLDIIIVDYLQRLHPDQARHNRYMEVGDMSGAMKDMAEELRVPVLVLAQLSRQAVGKEKPGLHHLRESGDIEQDADQVWILSRDGRDATLEIAKNRNGRCASLGLHFDAESMRFVDAY